MTFLVECYLSKIQILYSLVLGRDGMMSYRIEIELPNSGAWFKYCSCVDSLEEAKGIIEAAEGKVKARIRENT